MAEPFENPTLVNYELIGQKGQAILWCQRIQSNARWNER